MSTSESRTSAARPRTAARLPALDGAQRVSLATEGPLTVEAIAAELPDPATLAPGTLVVVADGFGARKTLTRALLSVLGRGRPVPRVLRCTALVARGYVDVGAARDADRVELAWGYVPTEPC